MADLAVTANREQSRVPDETQPKSRFAVTTQAAEIQDLMSPSVARRCRMATQPPDRELRMILLPLPRPQNRDRIDCPQRHPSQHAFNLKTAVGSCSGRTATWDGGSWVHLNQAR